MTGQLQMFGGDWTQEKLNILREYLQAYNTALKNQPFVRVYVDAFAGTGYRQARQKQFQTSDVFAELFEDESQQFLKGSAKLALESSPPFDRFIFVENDLGKIAELQKLANEHPDKVDQICIEQKDANEFIQEYCSSEDWSKTRAVVFLDPFATQVEWKTIEAIAETQAIDLWYLFPLMAVNRLLANDPGKTWRNPLNRVFGTDEWFERFYRSHQIDDIFGESVEVVRKACNTDAISQFFRERLEKVFTKVAKSPRILSNTKNTPLFQLFFAAGNPNGAPIACRIAEYLLRRM
jgi:three-Cys-motif partner protein